MMKSPRGICAVVVGAALLGLTGCSEQTNEKESGIMSGPAGVTPANAPKTQGDYRTNAPNPYAKNYPNAKK